MNAEVANSANGPLVYVSGSSAWPVQYRYLQYSSGRACNRLGRSSVFHLPLRRARCPQPVDYKLDSRAYQCTVQYGSRHYSFTLIGAHAVQRHVAVPSVAHLARRPAPLRGPGRPDARPHAAQLRPVPARSAAVAERQEALEGNPLRARRRRLRQARLERGRRAVGRERRLARTERSDGDRWPWSQ